MSKSVHFEVFLRRGAKGAWHLAHATPNRKEAIDKAEAFVSSGEATGAKVVKETLNDESGEYLTLKVREVGDAIDTGRVEQRKEAELPCFKPQDLYSHHARSVIARLLAEQLSHWQMTAIELMHRPDMLEQLEAAGTVVQHAIQKAAVAHAQSANEDAQSAVRKLNELVGKAFERIYQDNRAGRFPVLKDDRLDKLAAKYANSGDADYYLSAAIAGHLAGARDWKDKLTIVLGFMNHLPEDGPVRDLSLEVIDRFVAEMMEGAAALGDLLGSQENLGASLTLMADLFLGRLKPDAPVGEGVRTLAREFARDKLPNSRAAIAHRIISELKSYRRLLPGKLEEEIILVKTLATKMVMGQGRLLTIDQITEAFTVRSKRLVAHDVIDDYLQDVDAIDDKVEKLVQFEENIVGAENKRTLASYIKPILTSHKAEVYFVEGDTPVMQRMNRLAELQQEVVESGFDETQKQTIVDAFGRLACQIDERTGLIDKVDRNQDDYTGKVFTLLRLAVSRRLPEGDLYTKIKLRVGDYMATQDFRKAIAEADDVKGRIAELKDLLHQAGFDQKPQDGGEDGGEEAEVA